MDGISMAMAFVDFMPVVLFFMATLILLRDLYSRVVKGAFALMAAGSVMVFLAGFYKASWSMLYAMNICDFVALDMAFFPMQAPGFLLVFFGLISIKRKDFNYSTTALAVAPLVYDNNLIFLVLQVVGFGGILFCLSRISVFMKRRLPVALFILSFLFAMLVGLLGVKFDDSQLLHWITQLTNVLSQAFFFWGVFILHKAGLMKKPEEKA